MDKSKLIDKHLGGMNSLTNSSIKNYAKTGNVTGTLKMCLIEMLQDFEDNVRMDNVNKASDEVLHKPLVSVSVCVNCDQEKETHSICMDCLTKIINENKQTEL